MAENENVQPEEGQSPEEIAAEQEELQAALQQFLAPLPGGAGEPEEAAAPAPLAPVDAAEIMPWDEEGWYEDWKAPVEVWVPVDDVQVRALSMYEMPGDNMIAIMEKAEPDKMIDILNKFKLAVSAEFAPMVSNLSFGQLQDALSAWFQASNERHIADEIERRNAEREASVQKLLEQIGGSTGTPRRKGRRSKSDIQAIQDFFSMPPEGES